VHPQDIRYPTHTPTNAARSVEGILEDIWNIIVLMSDTALCTNAANLEVHSQANKGSMLAHSVRFRGTALAQASGIAAER